VVFYRTEEGVSVVRGVKCWIYFYIR